MVQYVNLDMTLGEIAASVLNEYKEPVAGSSAMSLHTVYDKINEVYLDIYNRPEDDAYLREASYTFSVVPERKLASNLSVGAIEAVLDSSVGFPNAARTVLVDRKDFVQYTTNDLTTTLSGVTGVDVDHLAGAPVQLGYPISQITDIDEQELNVLFVNGIKRKFLEPSVWLGTPHYLMNTFTIFNGNIFLDGGVIGQNAIFVYNKKLTLLTAADQKPTLIPGKFRPGLLVSGAIVRMGVRDEMRTGFEWHQNRFNEQINQFYAFANNRVQSKGPIMRPSIYDIRR